MFRHILPNALTPVVSFAPFAIVANISVARRARFSRLRPAGADAELGRADRPGHGEPDQVVAGVLSRSASLFVTLLLVVFIGEAVREAFDPKEYSRLAMTHDIRDPADASRCSRSAACAPTSTPKPASPRPSTASTSTSAPAKCSAWSASPAPARASRR